MDSWLGFFITTIKRKELKMAVIGLAILGIILGAAGMEYLRKSKPELVERGTNGVKGLWNSMGFSKSDDKKTKEK
jgi:hypothetical protein